MSRKDLHQRIVRLFDKGEFALAADVAKQFLSVDPDDGWLWQIHGTACFHMQAFDFALPSLERASSLVPLHPLAQYALAACYALAEKPDLASLIYEHLGEISRDEAMLAAVAQRLGALDHNESALQVCRRIIRLNANYHSAHFGVAYYLERLGYPLETLIVPLATAVDLAPHVPSYRINLAFIWERLGKNHQAYNLLKLVPLETIRCSCLLKRMLAIFEAAGDQGRSLVCKVRISCLQQ